MSEPEEIKFIKPSRYLDILGNHLRRLEILKKIEARRVKYSKKRVK